MKALRRPPKYCQVFEDRHGKVRAYYRRPGYPSTPLPGLPWTPEFMAAYEAAQKGEKLAVGKSKAAPGSFSALIASYYKTADFTGLSASTKATYRGIIERFRNDHGHRTVKEMEARHVRTLVERKADTPAAANNMLRMIHLLRRHAVELGWRRDDPTQGVRKVRNKSAGFLTWEEEHIATFLAHHKPGTRAHLALMLLLYTGQRRSDMVRMGRQHVRNGVLSITQQKTGQNVHIPLHPDLKALLDWLPLDNLSFLVTAQGSPSPRLASPTGSATWCGKLTCLTGCPLTGCARRPADDWRKRAARAIRSWLSRATDRLPK